MLRLALVYGEISSPRRVVVRVHIENTLCDVLPRMLVAQKVRESVKTAPGVQTPVDP